ncbi:MAG: nrfG [Verrucomicrobiales bacterium]|nr:nrfG [Verrucomicrobiales bacterium]
MNSEPSAEVQALLDDASGDIAVGETAAAALKYRQATELDPACFEAWHSLGMALMRSGELKAALGPALMATDLRPNDLLAWTALSQLYVKMGNIAEAEAAKGNARILSLGGRVAR